MGTRETSGGGTFHRGNRGRSEVSYPVVESSDLLGSKQLHCETRRPHFDAHHSPDPLCISFCHSETGRSARVIRARRSGRAASGNSCWDTRAWPRRPGGPKEPPASSSQGHCRSRVIDFGVCAKDHGMAGERIRSYQRWTHGSSGGVFMQKLIVNGDDFGLAVPVNEAIEEAHRNGILTSASLMVGAGAAEDAVARAKRLGSLRLGLHLVLVDGRAVLSKRNIPDLVNEQGEFLPDPI